MANNPNLLSEDCYLLCPKCKDVVSSKNNEDGSIDQIFCSKCNTPIKASRFCNEGNFSIGVKALYIPVEYLPVGAK